MMIQIYYLKILIITAPPADRFSSKYTIAFSSATLLFLSVVAESEVSESSCSSASSNCESLAAGGARLRCRSLSPKSKCRNIAQCFVRPHCTTSRSVSKSGTTNALTADAYKSNGTAHIDIFKGTSEELHKKK